MFRLNGDSVTDQDFGLTPQAASGLRTRLLNVGPQQFIEETLSKGQLSPKLLGTAFGLHPGLAEQLGDESFLQVLGKAIVRVYHKRTKLPQYNTIDDAAALLRASSNVMVITGAGISTSLGIPDFRSKETGFYTKLQAMGYTEPEEVFDIHEFDENPQKFYSLAADILPDQRRYSPTHGFIRLLQDKGKLQTNYTQNIDNIEELAGIEQARLIQAHGSFATASCRRCPNKVKGTEIFADIRSKHVARCQKCIMDIAAAQHRNKKRKLNKQRGPTDDDDDSDDDIPEPGVMKPDITFFGEQLPDRFFSRFTERDAKAVDLVIVIGTSLKVAPVSDMPNYLPHNVPHIYVSREPIEHVNFDVQLLGNCDDVVFELCKRAGWDLRHHMIPKGFKTKVDAVAGSAYRWTVKADGPKEPGTPKKPERPQGRNGTPVHSSTPLSDALKMLGK